MHAIAAEVRRTAWSKVGLDFSFEALSTIAANVDLFGESATAHQEVHAQESFSEIATTFQLNVGADIHLGIPLEQAVPVIRQKWHHANASIINTTSSIKFVLSCDEADLTVLNLIDASDDKCKIIVGSDSDYFFFTTPSPSTLQYTLSFSTFHDAETRSRSYKPWSVVSVSNLHAILNRQWPSHRDRFIAALMAGHDYTSSGIYGAGLLTLFAKNIVKQVSLVRAF